MAKVQTNTTPLAAGRLPILALAMFSLLAALWAGLIRLGWPWPPLLLALPMAHGPLMINGFLGTVIGLERAVALNRRWAYTAPLCTGAGAVLVILGWGGVWSGGLIVLGSALLLVVMAQIFRIHPALDAAVIGLGVALWLSGNLLWLTGMPVPNVVFWWAGFLILTIAGERLELSRFLSLSRQVVALFVGAVTLYIVGLLISLGAFAIGVQMSGLGMVALAAWLLRYDIAQRRLKAGGQVRFMALSLLSGYGWLAVGGILVIWHGGLMAGPHYDAMLHALFLGFVFSMIFAHAPIVFPAVLRAAFVYTPRFYLHLVLLHLTLLLRIAGDLLLWGAGRQWGGLLNALALLIFLANTVTALRIVKQ